MKVPPLEPAENKIYNQFLMFLVYFQYLVLVLQVIAYIQNVFLDGRSHQSIWSFIYAMQMIAHTSLFKINSIPGSLYSVYIYMIRFYSVTIKLPLLQVLVSKFTEKQAFSRTYFEMGYFSSNFIPLQFTAVCAIVIVLFFSILFNTCSRISLRNYKRVCCRWMGIILPSRNFFKRIFFRIYLLLFLQIFLSAQICLFPITSVKDEFERSKYDGASIVMAITLLSISVPILLHMCYVVIFNFQYLDDLDMKSSYGHYYVDLNTSHMSQTVYHMIFILRRMFFVLIILYLRDYPDLQLICHLCTLGTMLLYLNKVKPFKKKEYNMYEIVNETTMFSLTVLQQSFVNVSTDPTAKQIYSLTFISIWIILTICNLSFMIYSSFIQN